MPKSLPQSLYLTTLLCLGGAAPALAVDRSKFRKCEHTSFCAQHRYVLFDSGTLLDAVLDVLMSVVRGGNAPIIISTTISFVKSHQGMSFVVVVVV